MKFVADLHIHSKYSRATAKNLDLENLYLWAQYKGIHIVGTGDFVHPKWFKELEDKLEPAERGLFKLKDKIAKPIDAQIPKSSPEVRFLLTVEISNIYKRHDKVRKVHNLIFSPSLQAAKKIQTRLGSIGNISSDGRPILGLDSYDLLKITLEADPQNLFVPAHIWTPWFSALGSMGGFDSMEDAFGDLTKHIYAVETGLSSDPPMNWRLKQLDDFILISNSDAHSPAKLGREANIFDTEFSYEGIYKALSDKNDKGLVSTLEFFPEEGKYHYDGHRSCQVRWHPKETIKHNGICSACGKPVTVGVMSRVETLADRVEGSKSKRWRPYQNIVALPSLIAEAKEVGSASKAVQETYMNVLNKLGNEFYILLDCPIVDIKKAAGDVLAEGINRMRQGKVEIAAGYDGEFGTIKIFDSGEREHIEQQLVLFRFFQGHPMQRPHDLNESQWRAVQHKGSHLLITAGPGTGKTHTLTRRIAHLIPSLKSNEKILAITFTNKAARQMKDRLTALGVPQSQLFIGTFHGFCLKLLRDYFEQTALPKDFKIVMPEQIAGFDKKTLERISHLKSTQLAIAPDEEYKSYQRYLRQNSWIDFDDILREALLLLEDETIAQELRAQYRYLFVDEYQDSNIVQNALLKILAREGVLLTAIGDANQSIYGFRGSRVELFRRFKEDFAPVEILTLQENYRSAPSLLAASGQVMGGVQLLAQMETQGKLVIHQAATDRAEADYVAHQIEKLIGGLDMNTSRRAVRSFGDIVILYRLNAERNVMGQALEHLGIPYQVSQKIQRSEIYSDEMALGQNEEELEFNVEKVSLMTLHAAKGLEFPVVFIIGCEDNLLPLNVMAMKGEPQEERRLFYVGMTRAKEHLFLIHTKRRQLFGQTMIQNPSPYLADIAEELKAYEATKRNIPKTDPDALQMKLF